MLIRSIESEARHDAALLAKRIETETGNADKSEKYRFGPAMRRICCGKR
jgi:hypothetical protein